MPIYATEQNPRALGTTVPELGFSSDLSTDINPLGKALPKTKFSMLIPEIRQSLHEKEIKSVILVGIECHVCVLQSALDLLEEGFSVHVIADGVSSCNMQEIPIALDVSLVSNSIGKA